MSLLNLDASFDQEKLSRLRHQLSEHPLMSTEKLAELALRIDPAYVRFHDGERAMATNMSEMLTTDPTRQSLRKAIDNLGKAKAFVQIINVRSDPAYRALVDEVLDEAVSVLPAADRELLNRDAAAFFASPGSTTPFHVDHEQNFLCHIRGPKTIYTWDHRDRDVVTERAREIFYREGTLREVVYRPEVQPKATATKLSPGDTVYMPMGTPHAVETGNDVAVTFSVLMNTKSSFKTVETYKANHLLRRLGLKPKPVGDSRVRDSLKRRTLLAIRKVRDLTRGKTEESRPQWY